MTDDVDAAREYDRLRAELAEFVLGALSERLAAGQEPQLSQALIEAIDRRVDDAVTARLASVRGGDAARPTRRATPAPTAWFTPARIIALVVAALVLAAIVYVLLIRTPGVTRTQAYNGIEVITVEPTPDGVNAQAPPGNITAGNEIAPGPETVPSATPPLQP